MFEELSIKEVENVEGGSVWKYIGAAGQIAFGAYEVYTGFGAADGTKKIYIGATSIAMGIITALS